jgi:replicative DNA helicase
VAKTGSSRDKRAASPSRAIPADHEAERTVLGAILLDHESLFRVLDSLKPEHFDLPAHRILYESCETLAQKSQVPTLVALNNHLDEQGLLEKVGGIGYVAALPDTTPTAAHIEHHARIVREKALARGLIRTCEEIAAKGYEGGTEIRTLIDEAEHRVLQVAMGNVEVGFSGVRDELQSTFDYIERLQRGEITGVQTGFEDFDRLTGGMSGGDLVILAARPSIGKTALALNIARNNAVDYGGCVAVFSLEMTKRQLILRMLMGEAGIDLSRFRNGYLGDRDWPKLTRAADVLSDARVFIDDSGSVTVTDIAAKARRLHREHKLTLIVIDYVQLIQSWRGAERREQEIAETTRSLKLLAKDLDLPILLLSQLNRGPELRPNKRPLLADLRESGAIEQDADTVMFIYRDDYYNEDSGEPGIAELIISKQRNGPTGTVKLQFEKACARFHSLSGRDAPPKEEGFDPFGGAGEGGEPEPPF